MKKAIVLFILTILIVTGVSGCMGSSNTANMTSDERRMRVANELRDEFLQHLRGKYNREFIALSLDQRGLGNSQDVFRCYAEGDDPEHFEVSVVRRGIGDDVQFDDTYFNILIGEEVEDRVLSALSDMGLAAKAHGDSEAHYFPNEFDYTKNFEDLINSSYEYGVCVYVAVKMEPDMDTEDVCAIFFQSVKDRGFKGLIYLYFFNEEGYNEFGRDTFGSVIRSENLIESYRAIYMPDESGIIDWEEY